MRSILPLWMLLLLPAPLAAAPAPPAKAPEITVDWLFSDEGEALARPSEAEWTSDGSVLLLDFTPPVAERTFERVDPTSLRRTARGRPARRARQSARRARRESRGRPGDRLAREPRRRRAARHLRLRRRPLPSPPRHLALRTSDPHRDRGVAPPLSPDGRRVAFVRDQDLWLRDLGGGETRVTADGSATVLNGTLSWVYWEEIFDRTEGGIRWAPDSTAVAFLRTRRITGRDLDLRRHRAGDRAPDRAALSQGRHRQPTGRARHLRPRHAAHGLARPLDGRL